MSKVTVNNALYTLELSGVSEVDLSEDQNSTKYSIKKDGISGELKAGLGGTLSGTYTVTHDGAARSGLQYDSSSSTANKAIFIGGENIV